MSEKTYSPLRDGDLRLLTIDPQLHSGFVSCSLKQYSLQDIKPIYQQFRQSYDSPKTPNRWLISTWASIQKAKNPGRLNQTRSGLMASSMPPGNCLRYHWGDFAALSYHWAPGEKARILLNGRRTIVTGNLEAALRELGADGCFSGSYKLWVDALCINQLDQDETAEQVAKMRDIYSEAWTVVAWLGPPDRNSDQGFKLLAGLANLTDSQKDNLSTVLDKTPKHFGDRAFYGLHGIMARAYWWRLWIIQELVLGSASTIMRCGPDVLDWDTFCRGISTLYHGGIWSAKDLRLADELQEQNLDPDPRWMTSSLHLIYQNLQPLSQLEIHGGERQSLRKLLQLAGSECRETKDKVFALLGMMESPIVQKLANTYSQSTTEIFTTATVAFIEYYDNLEPLREANPWGDVETPSWVVDWTWEGRFRYSKPENNFIGPYWTPGTPEPRAETMYCADGRRRRAQNSFLPGGKLLKCRGFILDKICGLGACERGYFEWNRFTVVSPGKNWKSIYDDTAKALYQLLLLGRVSNGEHVSDRHSALLNLPTDYEPAFEQFEKLGWSWLKEQHGYYFRRAEWHRAHGSIHIDGKRLDSYFTEKIPEDACEFDYAEVFLAAERAGIGRRLMFTEKGYMGWAPDNAYAFEEDQTRIGDMVCIVFGCSTPLVIRPEGGHFQVLGEAYVEGLMDGEVIELLERGVFTQQDLVFC